MNRISVSKPARYLVSSYPARAYLGQHARASTYLSVVLQGSYVEAVGAATLECLPLSLRLHPAGEEHAHVFGSAGARCLNLELDHHWNESLAQLIPFLKRPLLVECGGRAALQAASLMHAGANAAGSLQELAAGLLDLCEQQVRVRRAGERSPAVDRAIQSIQDNPAHPHALTALASEAGLHPTHFARSFKATTGFTVGQFIRNRRLAHAQRLLVRNHNLSISRIAAIAGFADHAHFTRTFREAVGIVPSAFRAMC